MSIHDNGNPSTHDPREEEGWQELLREIEISNDQEDALVENPDLQQVDDYENPLQREYEEMERDIRVWAWFSLVLSVINFIIAGNLYSYFGIILLMIAGMSFLFKEAVVYIVYAVDMLFAGIGNLTMGEFNGWTILAVLQLYWTYRLYRNYQEYREIEQAYWRREQKPEMKQERARKYFPYLGFLMGVVGLVSMLGMDGWLGSFLLEYVRLPLLYFIIAALFATGALGFGLSFAALMAKFKPRWLAWIGLAAGGYLFGWMLWANIK